MAYKLLPGKAVDTRFGIRKSNRYQRIAEGMLTPPIKYGRLSLWPEHEIDVLISATIRGASDDEIRGIVDRLTAERARCGVDDDRHSEVAA